MPSLPRALTRSFANILLASFFVLTACSAGAVQTVAVVLGERGGYFDEFVTAFEAAAQSGGRSFRVVSMLAPRERATEPDLGNADAVIAVGAVAMRAVAGWSSAPPVLNVLVPRSAYERSYAEVSRTRLRTAYSAIWLDQDPQRLVALFRQTVRGGRNIGLLLGPDSQQLLPALREAATRAGAEVVTESVSGETEVLPALERLLPRVDGLLALPDSVVYTRETVRPVLLTTYRYRKPLIGFSQGYVTAGALAAVFSTPAQVALQAAELLRAQPVGRVVLPAPRYPRNPSVAINRQVARSLALDVPDEAALVQAMEDER